MNMSEPAKFPTENLRGILRSDVDMSRHVSWRAGGRAQRMYQPADLADLAAFLHALPEDEPLLAVGLGSNLLVRDGGLRGTVLLLHAALDELRIEVDGSIYAQAGVPGAKLARFAASHNLGGAEFFAGIPGTVGGMLAMNAGCYGSETWDKVERVQVVTRSGELLERTAQDYDIAYRHVALHAGQQELFAGAWLRFAAGDGAASREAIKMLLEKRISSQPLQLPNAGSVFRNPPGDHAARLIESCGLKGRGVGGAQVSEKHANFIVNAGGATAADIENLINEVQAAVRQQTGIELHREVRIIGENLV
ncbi:MAG: UDP-N-acetylmuramate dehydrogenase [Nitrosomonadales bacterium]|nr:UDP-N-acetylmuramate dehydrogenase [Nitrosomonadales bacterium]